MTAQDSNDNLGLDHEYLPSNGFKGALINLQPGRILSGTVLDLTLRLLRCASKPSKHLYTNPTLQPGPKLKPLQPEVEEILVPIHHRSLDHWTLVEFDLPERIIHHYDSLGPRGTKSPTTMLRRLQDFLSGAGLSMEEWSFRDTPGPIQTNAADCGVHILVTLTCRVCDLISNENPDCILWRKVLVALLTEDAQEPTVSNESTSNAIATMLAFTSTRASPAEQWETSIQGLESLRKSFREIQSDLYAFLTHSKSIEYSQAILEKLDGQLQTSLSSQTDPVNIQRDLEIPNKQLEDTRLLTTIPDHDCDALLSRVATIRENASEQLQYLRRRLVTLKDYILSLDAARLTASTAADGLRAHVRGLKCKARQIVQPLHSLTGALSAVAPRIETGNVVDEA